MLNNWNIAVSLLTGDRCEWMRTQSHREFFHFTLIYCIHFFGCYSGCLHIIVILSLWLRFVNAVWLLEFIKEFVPHKEVGHKVSEQTWSVPGKGLWETHLSYIKENVSNDQSEFSAIMPANFSYCGRHYEIMTSVKPWLYMKEYLFLK